MKNETGHTRPAVDFHYMLVYVSLSDAAFRHFGSRLAASSRIILSQAIRHRRIPSGPIAARSTAANGRHSVRTYSLDEIRQAFASSADFNEIFDAFQAAMAQDILDFEMYRLLFWNHALAVDEVRLFGEKLAAKFPDSAYDVYLWLASVFEVTQAEADNYELAINYYQKAASVRPAELDPYLDACDCYEPDLNIPPVQTLIDFVRKGLDHVKNPVSLYKRLGHLYEVVGDNEQSELFRRLADEAGTPGGDKIQSE